MSEWKEYTGSNEQIAELNAAIKFTNNGVLIKQHDGDTKIIYANLHGYRFTNYLICNPHPRREMIKQQADTGQPVWVKVITYAYSLNGKSIEELVNISKTTTPDWDIPNAEYSFTLFLGGSMINFLRRIFCKKQVTEEHFPDYKCKGICHKDMRCIDLPNHAEICTSKELVLTPETVSFLKEEIKKSVDQRWKDEIEVLINTPKTDPVVRRKACC